MRYSLRPNPAGPDPATPSRLMRLAGEMADPRHVAEIRRFETAAAAMLRALRGLIREADCVTIAHGGTPARSDRWTATIAARAAIAAAEAAGITDAEGDQARESAVLDGGAQ